jgi:hypothetical protein
MEGLIFVNKLGKNSDEKWVYEFYFSDEADAAWGLDWDVKPSVICNISVPQRMEYNFIKILNTDVSLNVSHKNSCFSMQDCKDTIIPVAWEDLDNAEEYPEEGRLVFPFSMDIIDVEHMLALRNLSFEDGNSKDDVDFTQNVNNLNN